MFNHLKNVVQERLNSTRLILVDHLTFFSMLQRPSVQKEVQVID